MGTPFVSTSTRDLQLTVHENKRRVELKIIYRVSCMCNTSVWVDMLASGKGQDVRSCYPSWV